MNNYDTPEKIKTIDTAIESVLKEHEIDFKNQTLYSWDYISRVEPHDVMNVYGHNGTSFNGASKASFGDNISVQFVDFKTSKGKIPRFALELSTQIYTGTANYNIVLSNVMPEDKYFNGKLYTGQGIWQNRLRNNLE